MRAEDYEQRINYRWLEVIYMLTVNPVLHYFSSYHKSLYKKAACKRMAWYVRWRLLSPIIKNFPQNYLSLNWIKGKWKEKLVRRNEIILDLYGDALSNRATKGSLLLTEDYFYEEITSILRLNCIKVRHKLKLQM